MEKIDKSQVSRGITDVQRRVQEENAILNKFFYGKLIFFDFSNA